jgi:glycosyltransferase involved in cell wall biosynthesis
MISQKNLYLITLSELGGAQKYVLSQAINATNNCTESIIVSGDKYGWLNQQAEKHHIETKVIHSLSRNIKPLKDLIALFALIKLIKKEKPTHLFLNSTKISLLGSVAGKICKVKNIIYTIHGWVFNEPLPSWQKYLYLRLEKYFALWKNQLHFINQYDLDCAKKFSIGNPEQYQLKKITILPIAFLTKNEARAKLLVGQKNYHEKIIIGTIANSYKTKALERIIDLAQQLQNYQQLLFVIVGDGPEQNHLQQKIKELKLNNIMLLGQKENAAEYLKAFDLFILTSVKEGSPYVLLEAIQADIPILATPIGGVPEILNSQQLCLPENFADKIKTLFNL